MARPDVVERAPSASTRWLVFVLLVAASCANLPILYALLTEPAAGPALVLPVGLASMGLAWSAGCSLEWRRRRSVVAIAAVAVVEPALLIVPDVRGAFDGVEAFLALASIAGVAALAAPLVRR